MNTDTKFLVGLIGSFALAICAVFYAAFVFAAWQCDSYAETTGRPTKFVAGNCYIYTDNAWFTRREYANRLITR